jgi:hypothetical protein
VPDNDRTSSDKPDSITFKAALDGKRELLAAIPDSELERTPGLDASLASGIVIGSLPRIAEHRDAIEAQFGEEGVEVLDDLPAVAYAAAQANIELAAADAASDLTAMHAEVLEDHALLLTDAEALVNRKLIDRARVDAGRAVLGYRTVIGSVLVLVALMREHWDQIRAKTPLTREDLDEIEVRAQRMLQRLNEREQGTSRVPASEMRARAISHLIRRYGEVRRMLVYVRWWQEDADVIAPSLWSGRRNRSRAEVVEPVEALEPAVSTTSPAVPVTAPSNGGAPFTD